MPVIINQLDVVAEPALPPPGIDTTAPSAPPALPRLIDLRRVFEHEEARTARLRAD